MSDPDQAPVGGRRQGRLPLPALRAGRTDTATSARVRARPERQRCGASGAAGSRLYHSWVAPAARS